MKTSHNKNPATLDHRQRAQQGTEQKQEGAKAENQHRRTNGKEPSSAPNKNSRGQGRNTNNVEPPERSPAMHYTTKIGSYMGKARTENELQKRP
jgi:hypothetical protein